MGKGEAAEGKDRVRATTRPKAAGVASGLAMRRGWSLGGDCSAASASGAEAASLLRRRDAEREQRVCLGMRGGEWGTGEGE